MNGWGRTATVGEYPPGQDTIKEQVSAYRRELHAEHGSGWTPPDPEAGAA
jgi:hypothetical protein